MCFLVVSSQLGFSTLKFSITVSNSPLIGMSVQPIKNLHLCDFFLYTCTSNLSVSLTGASNENKQHLPHFGPVGSTHWPSSRSHIDKKTLFLNEISQHVGNNLTVLINRESTPEAHVSLLGENVRGVFDRFRSNKENGNEVGYLLSNLNISWKPLELANEQGNAIISDITHRIINSNI
ncbi:hypothetical protein GQX74_012327 [Glossina fuscipes]|nr:hypothetical protein GQX74_012327 [Glossina fuscipes]